MIDKTKLNNLMDDMFSFIMGAAWAIPTIKMIEDLIETKTIALEDFAISILVAIIWAVIKREK